MNWKEKLNAYRYIYSDYKDEILKSNPNRFVKKYKIYNAIAKIGLSPIEETFFYECINSNVVVYPQYPIDHMMVDFCNPVKKIIIECDGKKYHNLEKDRERDEWLIERGYKVFRLSGSTINRDAYPITELINELIECLYTEEDPELIEAYHSYYNDTAEGFVDSLKDILFNVDYFTEPIYHFDFKLESLMRNRIDHIFKITPDYNNIEY